MLYINANDYQAISCGEVSTEIAGRAPLLELELLTSSLPLEEKANEIWIAGGEIFFSSPERPARPPHPVCSAFQPVVRPPDGGPEEGD
jgi:hypothetical protein